MERKVFDAFAVEDHERGLGRVEWWAFGRDRVDASGGLTFRLRTKTRNLVGRAWLRRLNWSSRTDLTC